MFHITSFFFLWINIGMRFILPCIWWIPATDTKTSSASSCPVLDCLFFSPLHLRDPFLTIFILCPHFLAISQLDRAGHEDG